ncbi:MAG TPA: VCBS repeat-containing protein [Vicinamibacteria bacterium]|jgi:hypothetical protein
MGAGIVVLAVALAAPGADEIALAPGPGSPIAVGRGPVDVIARDLDGDGRTDLAVAAREGVVLLRGDGRGAFTAAGAPLAAAGPPHLLASGDLDRDGRPDLVATSHDTHEITAWRSVGGGRFEAMPWSPAAALPSGRAHNHGLAVADLDGDGWLDVTTADDEAHVLAVLRGGPAGWRPAEARTFPVGDSPYPHALGDLDRDGHLDAVVPNTGSASLSVLRGDGRGGFAPAPGAPVAVPPRPFYVALGDVDGTGALDAIVTHDDRSTVSVLLGDGRGGLRAAAPVAVGHRTWKTAVADFDQDGRPDLVLAGEGRVSVLAGDGRGRFRAVRGSPFRVGGGAWSVAVADFDGDGRLDVATADVETGTVAVLLSARPRR